MNTRVVGVTVRAARVLFVAAGISALPGTAVAQEAALRPVASRLPTNLLGQLDESLQRLASNIAPAVVQIEAMGFGPAETDVSYGTFTIHFGGSAAGSLAARTDAWAHSKAWLAAL